MRIPALVYRTHEYRIGEVTARLHPTTIAEIVGRAPDAFDPTACGIAAKDLASQLRALADAIEGK